MLTLSTTVTLRVFSLNFWWGGPQNLRSPMGSSYTLEINQLQILHFYVKMNHFEVYLMVFIKKSRFQIDETQDGHSVFFSDKKAKWRILLEILGGFSLA